MKNVIIKTILSLIIFTIFLFSYVKGYCEEKASTFLLFNQTAYTLEKGERIKTLGIGIDYGKTNKLQIGYGLIRNFYIGYGNDKEKSAIDIFSLFNMIYGKYNIISSDKKYVSCILEVVKFIDIEYIFGDEGCVMRQFLSTNLGAIVSWQLLPQLIGHAGVSYPLYTDTKKYRPKVFIGIEKNVSEKKKFIFEGSYNFSGKLFFVGSSLRLKITEIANLDLGLGYFLLTDENEKYVLYPIINLFRKF